VSVQQSEDAGVLVLDKPAGRTSHDIVARARRSLGTRRVGHAGTLDPMATGVLILGFGPATRLLTFLVGLDKEYAATIRLGVATTTDDAEGEVTASAAAGRVAALEPAALRAGIAALTGDILQTPSTVSAIKIGGRPAYRRVRDGEEVSLQPRPVRVAEFALLDSRPGRTGDGAQTLDLDVRVVCSSGTYIRALARDLGSALGVGGHLTALRRTRVGAFSLEDAASPDEPQLRRHALTPAQAAARAMPVLSLDAAQARELRHGRLARVEAGDDEPVAGVHESELVGVLAVHDGTARVLANMPFSGPPDRGQPEPGREGRQ